MYLSSNGSLASSDVGARIEEPEAAVVEGVRGSSPILAQIARVPTEVPQHELEAVDGGSQGYFYCGS